MRSDRSRLLDILDAIVVIEAWCPKDRETFDGNPPVQSHLHRHLVIIGEAAFRLSKELKRQHPEVPWPQIEGMRHILVHEYFRVNWTRVYQTSCEHVPALKPQIEAILASLPEDE